MITPSTIALGLAVVPLAFVLGDATSGYTAPDRYVYIAAAIAFILLAFSLGFEAGLEWAGAPEEEMVPL